MVWKWCMPNLVLTGHNLYKYFFLINPRNLRGSTLEIQMLACVQEKKELKYSTNTLNDRNKKLFLFVTPHHEVMQLHNILGTFRAWSWRCLSSFMRVYRCIPEIYPHMLVVWHLPVWHRRNNWNSKRCLIPLVQKSLYMMWTKPGEEWTKCGS